MTRWLAVLAFGVLGPMAMSPIVLAQDEAVPDAASARPAIQFNRWQEDWSVLADPNLRTEPFDDLKYISLLPNNPQSYVSLGADLRERFESLDASSFGVGGNHAANYLLQRALVHADIHPDQNWQIFTQLEDARAFDKSPLTPVDEDKFDLAQGFVTYTTDFAGGQARIRVGRQEMAFDRQRFVSVRDGPNVRQAFDALWLNWKKDDWRFITFWSQPVQDRNLRDFDDYSNGHFQYGGVRIERRNVGPGELSAYWSRYDLDNAHFLFAAGHEQRDNFDVRYAGDHGGWDWDLETMGQSGYIATRTVRAWALGALGGYTFAHAGGSPRVGLQFDAASGNQHPASGTFGTFNPLFPNGYYFTLAGFTGYTNLIHLKPSLTLKPSRSVTLLAAVGLQWRETTADAVYVQPDIPVPGTAGAPGRWSGIYEQVRADWAITANFAAAVEAVRFEIGNAIRQAGGHDAEYVGVEMRFDW